MKKTLSRLRSRTGPGDACPIATPPTQSHAPSTIAPSIRRDGIRAHGGGGSAHGGGAYLQSLFSSSRSWVLSDHAQAPPILPLGEGLIWYNPIPEEEAELERREEEPKESSGGGSESVIDRIRSPALKLRRKLSFKSRRDRRGNSSQDAPLSVQDTPPFKKRPLIQPQSDDDEVSPVTSLQGEGPRGFSPAHSVTGVLTVNLRRLELITDRVGVSRCVSMVMQVDDVIRARTAVMTMTDSALQLDHSFSLQLERAQRLRVLLLRSNMTSQMQSSRTRLCAGGGVSLSTLFTDSQTVDLVLDLEPRGKLQLSLNLKVTQKGGGASVSGGSAQVFGAELTDLVQREMSEELVPLIVQKTVNEINRRGLKVLGIYRVCGSSSLKQKLRLSFEKNSSNVDLKGAELHDITGILKDFLRELPSPLVTLSLCEEVRRVMMSDPCVTLDPVQLLQCLPPVERATLSFLLDHLALVCSFSSFNKMSAQNVAVCFGPVLFIQTDQWEHSTTLTGQSGQGLDFKQHIEALHFLLTHWPVPPLQGPAEEVDGVLPQHRCRGRSLRHRQAGDWSCYHQRAPAAVDEESVLDVEAPFNCRLSLKDFDLLIQDFHMRLNQTEDRMASSRSCCGAPLLQVVLSVMLLLMTVACVGLIIAMATGPNTDPPPPPPPPPSYLIGLGRADCTGPPAEVPLMGYANAEQTAAGLHTRLYSRAFIVDDGRRRVVFVSVDVGMVSQRLRLEVLQGLKQRFGSLYTRENVLLSGTHTHSGLGGYFQYTLFMLSTKGYIKASVQPLVQGIIRSIAVAHRNMRSGRIFRNSGPLQQNSLNRSPQSYSNNPQEERERFPDDTDKQVTVLKFTDADGDGLGVLSWFAVHAVSMNYTNRLVSSDNMGLSSIIMETEKNQDLPGEGRFVAAFCSSNLGDVTPNTRGPYCSNTGLKCDYLNSSCPVGGTKFCQGLGPSDDMFESTWIIAENIYKKTKELYVSAVEEVLGPLHFAHQWIDMSNVSVRLNSTHTVRTCKPALGHSFAAGTTDGGGDLNFTQGSVEGDPFWDGIRDALLGAPSNETQDCHRPKPILFSTGEMSKPLPWHPTIIDVQILVLGSLAILGIPGEITTMGGRRLRKAVRQELQSGGSFKDVEVVVAGLSNVYTHYITTYEEYQVQRYEGASTIYGPHTLSAYIQQFTRLSRAIREDSVSGLDSGPEPPFVSKLFSLLPAAAVDKKPENSSFGDVLDQVHGVYRQGDVASVTFVAGNPRHSEMPDHTFAAVEKFDNLTQKWDLVYTDASWETRFHWLKGEGRRSNATVQWFIPDTAPSGWYRILHAGHYKEIKNFRPIIKEYSGQSEAFRVVDNYYTTRT
uniref:Neutral ceramidase n=1 Tax=Knipowitschia caucasica TaxID=637954 RepID=A0AAV2LGY6_KNICA